MAKVLDLLHISTFIGSLICGIFIYAILWGQGPPERPFLPTDGMIALPIAKSETISWNIPLIAIIPAVLVMLGMELWRKQNTRIALIMWLNFTLDMLSSYIISIGCTEIIKRQVGELRPDFLAHCNPDTQTKPGEYGRCLNTIVNNDRQSFPSSHASVCFSISTYLSLYFYWTFYNRTPPRTNPPTPFYQSVADREWRELGRIVVLFIPSALSIAIGVSRLYDHRHHPWDVLAGAMIGIFFSGVLFVRLISILRHIHADYELSEKRNSLLGSTEEAAETEKAATVAANVDKPYKAV